jgi:hypothetical protein
VEHATGQPSVSGEKNAVAAGIAKKGHEVSMSYHSFSLDPRTVLGVAPNAALDEIHEAYRAKSKKHHPDLGGDEWAFRMVARAYEVLKATTGTHGSVPWDRFGVNTNAQEPRPGWSWVENAPCSGPGDSFSPRSEQARASESKRDSSAESNDNDRPGTGSNEAEATSANPHEIQIIDVELIWMRFDREGSRRLLPAEAENDVTLSVYMVVSWPPPALVEHAVDFSAAGDVLHTLIDLFEQMRGRKSTIAARSRIEDGQFVGWLSFPDVVAAQDTFLALRETAQARGLTVRLHTRDERVPFDWRRARQEPVMS